MNDDQERWNWRDTLDLLLVALFLFALYHLTLLPKLIGSVKKIF